MHEVTIHHSDNSIYNTVLEIDGHRIDVRDLQVRWCHEECMAIVTVSVFASKLVVVPDADEFERPKAVS